VLCPDEQGLPPSPFGHPRARLLSLWNRLSAESGVEFDLCYSPRAFEVLLSALEQAKGAERAKSGADCGPGSASGSSTGELAGMKLVYLHCGGTGAGVQSQLARYRRAGLFSE
jgi:1-aminocyclopropane-1-carboxylate deaminase/D-cysteine desulfhydrase-like pyridoxal-dependent ACC family enzyme